MEAEAGMWSWSKPVLLREGMVVVETVFGQPLSRVRVCDPPSKNSIDATSYLAQTHPQARQCIAHTSVTLKLFSVQITLELKM